MAFKKSRSFCRNVSLLCMDTSCDSCNKFVKKEWVSIHEKKSIHTDITKESYKKLKSYGDGTLNLGIEIAVKATEDGDSKFKICFNCKYHMKDNTCKILKSKPSHVVDECIFFMR